MGRLAKTSVHSEMVAFGAETAKDEAVLWAVGPLLRAHFSGS